MRTVDLILKKRQGQALEQDEIESLIAEFTQGEIPDYQMTALLMAICFQGMNQREIVWLTNAMAHSGTLLDLSVVPDVKVDKHSTGGVGDTTTLVVAPLVAAAGVPVAKMSGRGLGHTGGTIDKLEAIPGFCTTLSLQQFLKQLQQIHIAVMGQTAELAPADGKLYALRDVTGTVDSIPLIASSIMSKKIAAGADKIVLDVKFGQGAFMQTVDEALHLAKVMVDIGQASERETVALVTNMDEPLGQAVGNGLEVAEAIEVLNGKGPAELRTVCCALGAYMLLLAGKVQGVRDGWDLCNDLIDRGDALRQFSRWITAQGGSTDVMLHPERLYQTAFTETIYADQQGYVGQIKSLPIGEAAGLLGAGREVKGQAIDLHVGIQLYVRVGCHVVPGQVLAKVYGNDRCKMDIVLPIIREAFTIGSTFVQPRPLIAAVVTVAGTQDFMV